MNPSFMKWRRFRILHGSLLNQSRCGWMPTSDGSSVMRGLVVIHRDRQDGAGYMLVPAGRMVGLCAVSPSCR